MRTPRVLVLVLEADRRFRSGAYLLSALVREWRTVVNKRLITVAKSAHSDILVRENDGYAGPVIVKTDLAGALDVASRDADAWA